MARTGARASCLHFCCGDWQACHHTLAQCLPCLATHTFTRSHTSYHQTHTPFTINHATQWLTHAHQHTVSACLPVCLPSGARSSPAPGASSWEAVCCWAWWYLRWVVHKSQHTSWSASIGPGCAITTHTHIYTYTAATACCRFGLTACSAATPSGGATLHGWLAAALRPGR